ncbi:MAG: hypothetical protein ACK5M7_14585 [Draconibacterium sp.]
MQNLRFIVLVVFLQCLLAGALMGQDIRITPFSGYTFADKTSIYGGRARIGDGHTYGGFVSLAMNPFYEIELQYSRQDAQLTARSSFNNMNVSEAASINYIMAGGNRIFPMNETMEFFSGVKVGASIVASKNDAFDNVTKFAVNINGGIRYFFNDVIGIRIQADLGMPMVDMGGNLWWSPGYGVDVGVSGWSPFLQFGFKGGLVFCL